MASDDVPVIDFAAHYHPPPRPHSDDGLGGLIKPLDRDPEAFIEWFHEGGVDRIVLSQPSITGSPDAGRTAEGNDNLLPIIEDHDEFFGLAALPVAAGGTVAAEELERTLEMGFNGGSINTNSDGIALTSDEIRPVFEVANDTGAPLLVHQPNSGPHKEVLGHEHELNFSVGREAATAGSIIGLIHSGVLDEFEDLTLVFHHLGGNIAGFLGRVHLHLDPGRWPDQEGKSFEAFKAQLEDRVYLDTSGYFSYPAPLRTALEEFPASQLLMGTDAPFEPRSVEELRRYVTSVRELTPETESKQILGGNALDLMVNVD